MQIHTVLLAKPDQQLKQCLSIAVVFENQLAVVATQYHVVRVTGQ
jgi:hypothetical protein